MRRGGTAWAPTACAGWGAAGQGCAAQEEQTALLVLTNALFQGGSCTARKGRLHRPELTGPCPSAAGRPFRARVPWLLSLRAYDARDGRSLSTLAMPSCKDLPNITTSRLRHHYTLAPASATATPSRCTVPIQHRHHPPTAAKPAARAVHRPHTVLTSLRRPPYRAHNASAYPSGPLPRVWTCAPSAETLHMLVL